MIQLPGVPGSNKSAPSIKLIVPNYYYRHLCTSVLKETSSLVYFMARWVKSVLRTSFCCCFNKHGEVSFQWIFLILDLEVLLVCR